MKHRNRILLGVAVMTGFVAPVGTFAFSGGPAAAAPPGAVPMAYTCSGGDFASGKLTSIASGNYASITVTGACDVVPGAVINVAGNVTVAAGAVFDAQSAPSTIAVGHNVFAGAGALLGLGCFPNPPGHTTGHPCVDAEGNPTSGSSHITVGGNLIAIGANTVLLNGISVDANVVLNGGGGAIPWAIKANTIGGNLIVSNMAPNWLGVIVNKVGGNVILFNVHITDGLPPNNDPNPTIFVASNTVGQNLICLGLGPAVSGGFGNEHNVVGHQALGQCAHLTNVPPSASS